MPPFSGLRDFRIVSSIFAVQMNSTQTILPRAHALGYLFRPMGCLTFGKIIHLPKRFPVAIRGEGVLKIPSSGDSMRV